MEYSTAARFHDSITQFKVYEDYLDSKVTPMDLFYLKSRELARKLVEHGHKGTVLSREEFEEKKAAAQAAEAAKSNTFYNRSRPIQESHGDMERKSLLQCQSRTLASAGKELKDNFLKALAEREEANRSGKMTSVIFIRDHNTLGQEVSGYIDYAHRLKTQDFEPYFSGKKRLMPGRSDLCYYNWKTQVSTSNSSPNFEVIYDDPNGLLFKNKRDKKILNVEPLSGPGEDSNRTFLQSDLYIHVVIYDHNIRTV
ncbi:cilia- and flagella-associated protein 299 isoform X2 [Siniperca chuatsi]|uniref:cilia- and flagella-associated protein 299 isoform X2 n=1 Tax=Siniperca chuatsi TaxID=119488 RepID=UPI001CE20F0B|nr:cilia- and flagella-associated protein 299 isoform X2 [Siniperca chuatsi]